MKFSSTFLFISRLIVLSVIGCHSPENESEEYNSNISSLREHILLDTALQNQFKQFDLNLQLFDTSYISKDSIDKYLIFINLDLVDTINTHIKNSNSWKDFTYPTLNDLMKIYDTVRVDNQDYFLVEGDILLTYQEIFPYHLGFLSYVTDTSRFQSQKLVGEIRNGNYVKQEFPLNMRYSIIKSTFTNQEYNIVKEAMYKAVSDWMATCNVNLKHIVNLDAELSGFSNPNDLTFVIKKVNVNGNFIANSFFPNSPKTRRKILIDSSFFSTDFSQSGVLRHEIGHILGFLHEHIHTEALPVCEYEPRGAAIDLNEYDPKSVMHYFCCRVGTKELLISENDKIGAAIYYPF